MPSSPKKTDALLELASKGPLRARDLTESEIPRIYLRRLCERGLLERVDRGLYELVDGSITEGHTVAEVAKRIPHGIICLMSALEIHELTTEAPPAVWVMLDTHARVPKLSYPKLEIVWASGPARDYGVETRLIEGVPVRLTSPAKTVADCFRYRRHVGLEVALEALRDYLRKSRGRTTRRERQLQQEGSGVGAGLSGTSRGDGYGDPFVYSVGALMEAARADRIWTVMRPYLEALV